MVSFLVISIGFFIILGMIYLLGYFIIDGNFLKLLDKDSKEYSGTLVDYQGTSSTSEGGQTILLFIEIHIDGKRQVVSVKESRGFVFISKLYVGKPMLVRYSPKYKKAKTIDEKWTL